MILARLAVLAGYFGLLLLWLAWATLLAPARHAPTALVLAIAALPLLMPLRGLLYARPSAYLALGLLSLLYFMHGISAFTNAAERGLASVEIGFSLLLFAGCVASLRRRGAAA